MNLAPVLWREPRYLRSRHRRPERNFEIIAVKVISAHGETRRFAFARNGGSMEAFAHALVRAGVRGGTPATILSDGDEGFGVSSVACCQRRPLSSIGSMSPCASNETLASVSNIGHRTPVLARSLTEPTSLLCTLAAVATFHAPVIAHATPSPASPAGDALGDGRLPRRSNEDRAR